MNARGHRLADLAIAVGGTLHGSGDVWITDLSIDSRQAIAGERTLFIALRGERHDGHRYIPALAQQGVRCFLVNTDRVPAIGGVSCIAVPDTLDALQRMAAWHRGHFPKPVVGITGSNGKTVVKEWLFQLLRGTEHIARSPGSWNSQVGVPLSVWELGAEHTLGLFEAGISKPGEMEKLRAIIKPTIGVFTTLGPAHGENFQSDLQKALEKAKLFHDARHIVYCRDHAVVHEALVKSGLYQRAQLLDWSREQSAFVHVTGVQHEGALTHVKATHAGSEHRYTLPFADAASLENALHCITLLLHLGHAPEWIAERLLQLEPVAMRMQMLEGVHDSTLINDAYSNDVASLGVALDHLVRMSGERRRVVVLTDILESGETPELLYERVGRMLKQAKVEQVFAVGTAITAHAELLPANTRCFPDTDALLVSDAAEHIEGRVVLIKGARTFGLERVVERWQQQVHGTQLEIDLEALRHNLNHYRALLTPSPSPRERGAVKVMAMVKAFGYGGGALELSRLFAHEQVDYLGVAYADEGIELRQNGIHTPVMVMNPEPVPFEILHRFRLEPEVYDLRTLREAIAFARHVPDAPPVHLKLDTGMHRLGFTAPDLPHLLDLLRTPGPLRIGSLLSHLAASEDPQHDEFTRGQIARFSEWSTAIGEILGYTPLWHIANSGGITRFPEAHFDMVRLGIGLHGIGTDASETAKLRTAATLRTVIAQVKDVAPQDSVGYGRRHRAEGPLRIAVLPIGYADGLSRRLGNGHGRVWIHGKEARFVGSICMDMAMVDVTHIPCSEGEEAIVFGPQHPLSDYARDLGTIPYEALTSISQRVKRVYVHG
jgi:alanine racemase